MTVLNACLFGVMDSGSEEESTSKVRIHHIHVLANKLGKRMNLSLHSQLWVNIRTYYRLGWQLV